MHSVCETKIKGNAGIYTPLLLLSSRGTLFWHDHDCLLCLTKMPYGPRTEEHSWVMHTEEKHGAAPQKPMEFLRVHP